MNRHQIKAKDDIEALWKFYKENGEITYSDICEVLAIKNAGQCIDALKKHGEPPPVSSKSQVTSRKYSDQLMTAAAGERLTIQQMADTLGITKYMMVYWKKNIINFGFPLPVNRTAAYHRGKQAQAPLPNVDTRTAMDEYPAGLQVSKVSVVDGRKIYLLR